MRSTTGKSADLLLEERATINRRLPEQMEAEDLELYEKFTRYSTHDVFLRDLGPTMVSPDSVVYKGGRVFVETLVDPSLRSYYQFRHLFKKLILGRRIGLGSAKHLLVTDAWSVGHYHWVVETLPRLWLVRDLAKDFVLLLPDSAYVKTVGMDSLRMLGLEFRDVIFMKEECLYSAQNLSWISRIAEPGAVHDGIMRELRAKLLGQRQPVGRRLYVSRQSARFRKVINEDEVMRWMTGHGFEVIRNEELDLAGQLDLFSGASVVMGIHGAGLTNSMFADPAGILIEISKRQKNHAYWHLADSVGLRYRYFYGTPDSDRGLFGEGCNLTVDISDLEARISPVLAGF